MFIYGAQYYRAPNPPRGERKKDIEQMARLGFNVVKIQAHWNWINHQPGLFDFGEIEELLDYATQGGGGIQSLPADRFNSGAEERTITRAKGGYHPLQGL